MEASRDYTIDEHGTVHLVLRSGPFGIDTKCGLKAVTIPLRLASGVKIGGTWCHTCYVKEKKAKRV